MVTRYMRCLFDDRIGICNALFDTAWSKRDKQIFVSLSRSHQNLCFFIRCQIAIAAQLVSGQRGISIQCTIGRIIDFLDVCFHTRRIPSSYSLFQRIIPCLFFSDISIHICHAIFQKSCFSSLIQCILPIFHICYQGLIFIVLILHFGDEKFLLLINGCLTSFQNSRLCPSIQFFASTDIIGICEIIINEATIGSQCHITTFGNDTIQVQIIGVIHDGNITMGRCFQSVIGICKTTFWFPCFYHQCSLIILTRNSATSRSEFYPICLDSDIVFLGNPICCGNRSHATCCDLS